MMLHKQEKRAKRMMLVPQHSQKCIRSDIRYDTVLNLYHTFYTGVQGVKHLRTACSPGSHSHIPSPKYTEGLGV